MPDYTALQVVWFVLISILWLGYFVLEGFDFGVGMLIRVLGRNDAQKRAILHTIGPLWDGNEVWLIVAGGATFAAFPEWYATLFSGFYLALFLILVGLIVRNVSFEFWGKGESDRWRRNWEWAMILGSALPALVIGVVTAPLWIVAAVAVAVSSHGPVLYRQRRVGLAGREFTMYKLRSMVVGADQMLPEVEHGNSADGPLFKHHTDPRVTAVGRVLRRWSLDELPQLLNVLKGDMALVGPRPPLPEEVEKYAEHVHRRLMVRPGITGLWQVSGRSDLSWEESVRLDLYYVDNWSLTSDFVILLKTVRAVLFGAGAY